MNCPTCHQPNPDDARFCGSCGVQIAEHTGDRGEIAGLVNRPPDTFTQPSPARTPTESFSSPPADPIAPDPSMASSPGAPLHAEPQRKSSIFPIAVAVAAVGAVVLVGALLILSDDSDDSIESTDPAPTTVTTVTPATSEPAASPTTIAAATTTPAATAPAITTPATAPPSQTAPATTAPAATTPETVAPTSTEPTDPDPTDPAAVPPVPPEPGPVDAPGSPQVLANVLPSGVAYTDVATSFATAQALGDALALEQWDQARALLPSVAGEPDAAFVTGYGRTNRISLMLVDARQAAGVDQLLVVSVAVEFDGAQTSLFCLQWDVSTDAGTVAQINGRSLGTWPVNAQPEAIRNDPDAMDTVAECIWE